jgi:hypothetical protein
MIVPLLEPEPELEPLPVAVPAPEPLVVPVLADDDEQPWGWVEPTVAEQRAWAEAVAAEQALHGGLAQPEQSPAEAADAAWVPEQPPAETWAPQPAAEAAWAPAAAAAAAPATPVVEETWAPQAAWQQESPAAEQPAWAPAPAASWPSPEVPVVPAAPAWQAQDAQVPPAAAWPAVAAGAVPGAPAADGPVSSVPGWPAPAAAPEGSASWATLEQGFAELVQGEKPKKRRGWFGRRKAEPEVAAVRPAPTAAPALVTAVPAAVAAPAPVVPAAAVPVLAAPAPALPVPPPAPPVVAPPAAAFQPSLPESGPVRQSAWGAGSGTHAEAAWAPTEVPPADAADEGRSAFSELAHRRAVTPATPPAPAPAAPSTASWSPAPVEQSWQPPAEPSSDDDGGRIPSQHRSQTFVPQNDALTDPHSLLAQRAGIAQQALAELSQLSTYRPQTLGPSAAPLVRRGPNQMPEAPAAPARRSGPPRDANQVRSLLASFQSGTSRGREAAESDTPADVSADTPADLPTDATQRGAR